MKFSSVLTPLIIATTFWVSVVLIIQPNGFLALISILCICLTVSLAATS